MIQRNSMLKWGAIALLSAIAVGIVWDRFLGVAEDGRSLQVEGQGPGEELAAESLEVEQRELAALALEDPDSLAREEVAERAAVGAPASVEEQAAETGAASIPLHGVVLDPLGRTVPDVRVEWVPDLQAMATGAAASPGGSEGPRIGGAGLFGRGGAVPATQGPGDSLSPNQDLGTIIRLDESHAWSLSGPIYPRVQTDANGAFEFPGVPAQSQGTLRFGHQLFAGTPASQVVIPDGGEQSLFLPPRPPATPLVRIHLRDAQTGQELFAERVQPQLLKLPSVLLDDEGRKLPNRALKEPRPDQIARGIGWVELQLWPGTWLVELSSELSETVELRVEVPRSGPLIELEADPRVFDPARGWEAQNPTAEESFAPAPETAEGFDRFGADKSPSRQIGERDSDRTFRHTLRFGVGEVSAAYLELDLEALSGMAYNDSLGLEFYAGPRLGFSNRISAFTGGEWRSPTRRRLLVDLSNLPGTQGPVNLLPDLADGRLDVYVQDDTAVYDVRLFVQR